jgi:hypothetical protein
MLAILGGVLGNGLGTAGGGIVDAGEGKAIVNDVGMK